MTKLAFGWVIGSMMLGGAMLGAGCGPSVLSGSGGGVAETSTSSSSSSGATAAPDTAWMVTLMQTDPTACTIADSMASVGSLNQNVIITRVTEGTMGASVKCSVVGAGAGPYAINALATLGADTLDINIPSISTTATQASPAIGSVAYQSDKTVNAYSSNNCDFYFIGGTPETVVPGRIWVAFTCAEVTSGAAMSSCPLTQSYAVFENCQTSP